jgi:hypothetical protein
LSKPKQSSYFPDSQRQLDPVGQMRQNQFREKSAGGKIVGLRLAALGTAAASTPWPVISFKLNRVREKGLGEDTYGPFCLSRR